VLELSIHISGMMPKYNHGARRYFEEHGGNGGPRLRVGQQVVSGCKNQPDSGVQLRVRKRRTQREFLQIRGMPGRLGASGPKRLEKAPTPPRKPDRFRYDIRRKAPNCN
jgi:hypothetical protein